MLGIRFLIFQRKKPRARIEHKCASCKKPIEVGSVYLYENIVDYYRKTIRHRKRHPDCPDLEALYSIWDCGRYSIHTKELQK